ncbi:uncharacterized protein LOC104867117 [Fukomys damarensis]|uniref:uncharacterized protein LOC104867117 n=1 Tax=Fukomys damarensis TaxID=885580 RepID=UPI0005400D48|nr:uncharacterized protein LOC104867117 [Fukomys damarensis]
MQTKTRKGTRPHGEERSFHPSALENKTKKLKDALLQDFLAFFKKAFEGGGTQLSAKLAAQASRAARVGVDLDHVISKRGTQAVPFAHLGPRQPSPPVAVVSPSAPSISECYIRWAKPLRDDFPAGPGRPWALPEPSLTFRLLRGQVLLLTSPRSPTNTEAAAMATVARYIRGLHPSRVRETRAGVHKVTPLAHPLQSQRLLPSSSTLRSWKGKLPRQL